MTKHPVWAVPLQNRQGALRQSVFKIWQERFRNVRVGHTAQKDVHIYNSCGVYLRDGSHEYFFDFKLGGIDQIVFSTEYLVQPELEKRVGDYVLPMRVAVTDELFRHKGSNIYKEMFEKDDWKSVDSISNDVTFNKQTRRGVLVTVPVYIWTIEEGSELHQQFIEEGLINHIFYAGRKRMLDLLSLQKDPIPPSWLDTPNQK